MNKEFSTTNLYGLPTFAKGAARVVDLFGKLDEYSYDDNADYHALENDWINVGLTIYFAIEEYDKDKETEKTTCNTLCSTA